MINKDRLKADALDQLSKLSEMAHLGRSSIINAGPMMLIWGSAIIVATVSEALSERSAYTVAAWTVPIFLAFDGPLRRWQLTHSLCPITMILGHRLARAPGA